MSIGQGTARSEQALREGLSDTTEGTCLSVDWDNSLVTVNIGGGTAVMPMVGDAPLPGDKVRVAYMGQKPVCLGSRTKATLGTVAAVPNTGKVTVTGDDGASYRYSYAASETFSSGDRVRLDHAGQVVVCKLSSDIPPAPPVIAPAPADTGGAKEATFYPTDSGNFRDGVYSDAGAEISDSRSAFYYYDRQIEGSIPDGATILEARITLNQEWDKVPGTDSRMGTHADAGRGGEPALAGSLSVPGGSRSVDIRQFADALKTGAALGVGFYATYGWRRYGPASSSGQIYMKWSI